MRLLTKTGIGLLLIALLSGVACSDDTAVTAVPTPASSAALPLIPYDNPASGLAMQIPEGWVTQDYLGNVTLASSQDIIDGESLGDMGSGGFIVFLPIERDALNYQAGQDLAEGDTGRAVLVYRELLEREGASYEVIEPPFKLEGPNSTYIVARSNQDGADLLTLMGAVMHEGQVVFVSAAALEDAFPQLRPTFEQVLATLEVTRPVTP